MDKIGLGDYFEYFHQSGSVRKGETFTEERIRERMPDIIKMEQDKAIANYIKGQEEKMEAERKAYCADLKLHPEKYINRKGLIEKGLSPTIVKSMRPLFYRYKGQAKEYWYYNY